MSEKSYNPSTSVRLSQAALEALDSLVSRFRTSSVVRADGLRMKKQDIIACLLLYADSLEKEELERVVALGQGRGESN